MISTTCRGDIYLIAPRSRENEIRQFLGINISQPGTIFECKARGTYFDYWQSQQGQECWLEEPLDGSYYHIESDSIREGSMSATVMIGVFIPDGVNKKTVADDLRCRFGSATTLFKVSELSADPNCAYLSWVLSKHRNEIHQFKAELFEACAVDFATLQPADNDARAEIYKRRRAEIQSKYDESNRSQSKLHCNS